jgi:hypothetical protein
MRRCRRNPLDPYAFDTDPHPHLLGLDRCISPTARREAHLGVYTSTSALIAISYAISKASKTMLDEEPNCGVLFTLDTAGLDRLHDVDARIEAEAVGDVLKEILKESRGRKRGDPTVSDAIDTGDADAVFDLVDRYAEEFEGVWYDYPPSSWSEAVHRELGVGSSRIPYQLRELEPERLLRVLRTFRDEGAVPLGLVAEAIEQYRYMVTIGIERVLEVSAIRPIVQDLDAAEEYYEDDPDAPQLFTLTQVSEGDYYPDQIVLWKNPRPIPRQRDIELGLKRRVEYHGTDLSRARRAFPELRKHLKSPWSYSQP